MTPGRDRLAGTHEDAGHPAVFDRESFHLLIGEDAYAAVEQRLEEVADQAQALAAHILPLALTDERGVPARRAVDAAPGDLLLGGHKAGYVVRHQDAVAPEAELEPGDKLGLDRPTDRVR